MYNPKKELENRSFTTDVSKCARCGQDHESLVFSPLNNHPTYSHWVLCPVTFQPILLRIVSCETVWNGSVEED